MHKRIIANILIVTLVLGLLNHSGEIIYANETATPEEAIQETTEAESSEETTMLENNEETSEESTFMDMTISTDYVFPEDAEINNLIINGGTTNLNGHEVKVHGEVSINNGALYVNGGYLACDGNFTYNSIYALTMNTVNDTIAVNGDFVWNRGRSAINNGTIEVKGNYYDNAQAGYNFYAEGNHRFLFSGEKKQDIVQSRTSTFNTVWMMNYSEEGICSDKVLVAKEIVLNGSCFTYSMDGMPDNGICGWTLEEDEIHEGDLVLTAEELNLNGHTLTVEGSLIQMSGNININGGKLIVNGDYRLQSVQETELENAEGTDTDETDNETKTETVYGYSGGYLLMQNEKDEVWVQGDFVMGSYQNHDGKLTNGKLYVAGDFKQITYNSPQNFHATGNHETILNGEYQQVVSIAGSGTGNSCFSGLTFDNQSEEGIVLSGDVWVTGEVDNQESRVEG
ncbi:MAG: hypothetical protein PUF12_09960, partial [Thermoflexaceae bacterium]|nr:hypothetical protein [Thermoflexaceae bacterium]